MPRDCLYSIDMSEHYEESEVRQRDFVPGCSKRRRKRVLLTLALAAQALGYVVLTEARYEGQGLAPVYFRLTTMSDILSLFLAMLVLASLMLAILKPERLGGVRTVSVALLSGILLWLDIGIRHTPAEEFAPEAAVALLLAMFVFLATLLTRSRRMVSPIRRVLREGRNVVSIALMLMLLAFIYAFFFPTYSSNAEVAAFHADSGVILGAAVWRGNGLGERPSPALRERIDLGYQLLTSHAIPRLVVTGGSAPGKQAEAEVAKRELLQRGVDPAQIIEENSSHTTLEQVRFLHDELFQKQGWVRFVIVSDQYHLARVCDMCKFNGLNVIGSPSNIHEPFFDLAYYRIRESVAMIEYWLLGR